MRHLHSRAGCAILLHMDTKYILLIISWAALLAGIVLIVLSFLGMVNAIWGGGCLAVGAILSLIAVILRQKELKRREEEEKRRRK